MVHGRMPCPLSSIFLIKYLITTFFGFPVTFSCCVPTHLGEGGTENPRIEVEVDFSLEAEVPALHRKGQSHKNVTGFFFYAKMLTKKSR